MQLGAFEAKTKFSHLLDRAERGEEIVITRHGKPVARLIPAESDAQRAERKTLAAKALIALRGELKSAGISREDIREWIAEGRR